MSSKTLKAKEKKTKSALRGKRKHHAILIGLVAGVILAAFVSALTIVNGKPTERKQASDNLLCLTKDNQGNATCLYKLEAVRTDKKRMRGLSGRESLPQGQGMLFDFDYPGEQCMWMKDMKFSIDMIWLNEKKEVVKIVQSVSPETYPTSYCSTNTKYVIELNKGDVQRAGLDTGQRLNF